MARATRKSLTIGHASDVSGVSWRVTEYRPTAHGFDVALGWPDDMRGPGNPRVILTAELAAYLQAAKRPRDIDLPVTRTTVKRLRAAVSAAMHRAPA